VQRLPIEPISRASANQRAGRCGRVAAGICIRLYSQDDYDRRPEFTEPEILRTNLASVVLQMAALGLGDVARFPFLDPPDQRSVRDAIRLLDELGALHPDSRAPAGGYSGQVGLTALGRSLARLPVDPRLGRMLLAAGDEGCVAELLVIASALSIQDPRERPADQQDAAAAMHRRFADPTSDFVGYLNLWSHLRQQQAELSSSAFRRMCRAQFLNYLRVREWQDLHAQLLRIARDLKLRRADSPAPSANVHRAVLAGLLSHIGVLDEQSADRPAGGRGANQRARPPRPRRTRPDYRGARGARFSLVRDSALAASPPVWVMCGELVETNRLWGRIGAQIEPEWAEPLAAHLVTRIYSEPRWSARRGAAMATERVTLFGLPLVVGRAVHYASIDPAASRELFIRHALVEGDWPSRHPVLLRTRQAIERARELGRRARRVVDEVDDEALFAFFDQRIPAEVVSGRHFESWWKQARRRDPDLLELPDQLLAGPGTDPGAYPDEWRSDGVALPLTYRFSPGDALDGVVVDVPVAVLNQLPADPAAVPVAGQRDELISALLRALPKASRRALSPIADTAAAAVRALDAQPPPHPPLLDRLSAAIESLRGVRIAPSSWPLDAVPSHLRATYRVLGEDGAQLALGKDLAALRESLAPLARQALADAAPEIERAGLRGWDFGDLPREVARTAGGHSIVGYPSLVDEGGAAAVRVLASPAAQRAAMAAGTRRLLATVVPSPARSIAAALDNRAKLVLAANPHGSVAALLGDCADAAIDAIVAGSGGPAWDEAGFGRLADAVRAALPARALEAARAVAPVLELWRQLAPALAPPPSPATAAGVADMRAQLDRLVGPGFIARAGLGRLGDLTRYLRAIARRLDKAPRDPEADYERALRVEHVQAAFREALAAVPVGSAVPAELAEIAWTIEELRVSLFAQELGTRGRVSDTRIYRALAPYLPG
jgi:ATP-dependent helicase HrpA